MNKQESDIMNVLLLEPFVNQRLLSESSGYSLGVVNRSVKNLCAIGYLDSNISLTAKAKEEMRNKKPKNAIILAAGYGMRMVPINTEVPKGLLEIHGEPLIERLIKQLQEVGITDIYIVVGYMKERYEYLIDLYQVQLIVNMEYSSKNNLHSLAKVLPYLSNSYIIPCDIWCDKNPFKSYEFYSWYLVSEEVSNESSVRVNRKSELVVVSPESGGNTMIGICYLLEEQAQFVRKRIETMSQNRKYDESFWEDALYENGRMIVYARVAHACDVVEINTYEQLRDFDSHSNQLQTTAILEIAQVMDVSPQDIVDITILKKGMTNRSFLFSCHDQRYIMRIPGEGTDRLIKRKQ
ncbi:MAG: NTP transferase domain-containing protein [Lachnospiraceae bacterium]|nr:NTP transferase domain-containing protein [Lachnospiraceae bacterium]